MSDYTFITTVNAVTVSEIEELEIDHMCDEYGLDSVEEFMELSERIVKEQLSEAFDEDQLELLEVTMEEDDAVDG